MTSVARQPTLFAIAGGRLEASAASEAIRDSFHQSGRNGEAIYKALQAWTWKILTQRRYGPELRQWIDVLETTIATLDEVRQKRAATKIESLRDLVYESIQFGEHDNVQQVLQRAHVRTVLATLRTHGTAHRSVLAEATGLREANLSRVLAVVQSAGLVDREQRGKEALFTLSRQGLQACARLPSKKLAAVVPAPPAPIDAAAAERKARSLWPMPESGTRHGLVFKYEPDLKTGEIVVQVKIDARGSDLVAHEDLARVALSAGDKTKIFKRTCRKGFGFYGGTDTQPQASRNEKTPRASVRDFLVSGHRGYGKGALVAKTYRDLVKKPRTLAPDALLVTAPYLPRESPAREHLLGDLL